jgi:hypothetical protein
MKPAHKILLLALAAAAIALPAAASPDAAAQLPAGIKNASVAVEPADPKLAQAAGVNVSELQQKLSARLTQAGLKVVQAAEHAAAESACAKYLVRVVLGAPGEDEQQAYWVDTQLLAPAILLHQPEYACFAVLWQKGSTAIQTADRQKLAEAVENASLALTDEFIRTWASAAPAAVTPTPTQTDEVGSAAATVAPAKQIPTSQQAAGQYYIASKNSKVFHHPDCPFARQIAPKNLVRFPDRSSATVTNRRPCQKCNP